MSNCRKKDSALAPFVAGALACASFVTTPALADPPGATARIGHVGGSIYVHFAAAPPAGSTVMCSWSAYINDQYSTNLSFIVSAAVSNQLAVCNFNNAYRAALATPANDTMSSSLNVYVLPGSVSGMWMPSTWNQNLGSSPLPADNAWTVVSTDVYF
jgi:hypothetical protein